MKFIQLSTQKPAARPDVINELIDEKLKIKEGKRWGMELTDTEVDSMYANMASRMHQTADQLTQNLQKGGVNPQSLKSRIRAEQVWQQLVRGRYSASLQLSEKDVELALQAKNQSGQSTTAIEYTLRPILFLVPPGTGLGDRCQAQGGGGAACPFQELPGRAGRGARDGSGRAGPGDSQLRRSEPRAAQESSTQCRSAS